MEKHYLRYIIIQLILLISSKTCQKLWCRDLSDIKCFVTIHTEVTIYQPTGKNEEWGCHHQPIKIKLFLQLTDQKRRKEKHLSLTSLRRVNALTKCLRLFITKFWFIMMIMVTMVSSLLAFSFYFLGTQSAYFLYIQF